MSGPAAVILPFLGVVIGGAITYLIARRKTSGRIDTTEAATLWQESQDMRRELRNELVELRASVAADSAEARRRCDEQLAELRERIGGLELALRAKPPRPGNGGS